MVQRLCYPNVNSVPLASSGCDSIDGVERPVRKFAIRFARTCLLWLLCMAACVYRVVHCVLSGYFTNRTKTVDLYVFVILNQILKENHEIFYSFLCVCVLLVFVSFISSLAVANPVVVQLDEFILPFQKEITFMYLNRYL